MTTLLGVRELVTALFREIHFAELPYFWDGINSVVKSGNQSTLRSYARHGKLPHSKCEFSNSQKMMIGKKSYYNYKERHTMRSSRNFKWTLSLGTVFIASVTMLNVLTAADPVSSSQPQTPFARVALLPYAPPMDNARMIYSWQWTTGFSGMLETSGAKGPQYIGSGYDAGWWVGYHGNIIYVGMMIPTPDATVFFKADAKQDGDSRIVEDDHLVVQLSARNRASAASGKSLRIRMNANGAVLVEEVEFLPGQTRTLAPDSISKLTSDKQEAPGCNWLTAKLAIPASLLDLKSLDGQTILAHLAFSAKPLYLSWGGGKAGDWAKAGEILFDPAAPANVTFSPSHPRLFKAFSPGGTRGLNFSANGSILRGEGGKVNVTLINRAGKDELFNKILSFEDSGKERKYRLPLQTNFNCSTSAMNEFSIEGIHQAADGKNTLLLRQSLPFYTSDEKTGKILNDWCAARKITKPADFDADYIFSPYSDQIEVFADTTVMMNMLTDAEKEKGADINSSDLFTVEVLDARGAKIADGSRTLTAYKGRFVIKLPSPLPAGKYTVNYRLFKGEREIIKKSLTLTREKFPWEKNDLGRDKVVIPPFEPVKVEGQAVSVWGRRHLFDNTGFPKSITSLGAEMLDGPITLSGNVNGQQEVLVPSGTASLEKVPGKMFPPSFAAYEFVKGACPLPELLPTDGYQAKVSAQDKLGSLKVQVGAVVEYEGWCKFTVTLQPSGKTRIDNLDLVIPLNNSATIMKWWRGHDPQLKGVGRIPDGEGVVFDTTKMPKNAGVLNSMTPIVFIGQPDRGLWTFVESEQGWISDDAKPLTSLVREKDKLLLKYHIVNKSAEIASPQTFDIVLMASPVRPRPENYRSIFWKQLFSHDTPGFRYYGSGVNGFTLYTDEDYESLRKFMYESDGRYKNKTAEARAGAPLTLYGAMSSASAGMKELTTFGSSWIFTSNLRKEFMPDIQFKGRKSNGGTYTYETDEQMTPIATTMDQAYIDCNLWHMYQIGKRCAINGTFYDNYQPFPPERFRNTTDLTGTSWRRPDGSIQPKSNIFRKHEWQKRFSTAFWLMGRPPHQIGGNEPESSFQSNWFVEGVNDVEGSSDFIHDGKDIDKYAAWVASTSGLGQAAPSIQMITDKDGKKNENLRAIRLATAYCLLLDQPMRRKGKSYEGDPVVNGICDALEREVGFFSGAKHLPYWRDKSWLKTAPKGLIVGAYRKEDGKKTALAALNISEAAIDGKLTLDGKLLVGGNISKAYDMEDKAKADMLDGNTVKVRIAPHEVKFIILE